MASSSTFQPGVETMPTTQVELAISCRNLADTDFLSKSDPICVVYTKNLASDRWVEYGRTEVIQNNLNPEFVRKFVMEYYFEELQKLKLEVYDVDAECSNLSDQNLIGTAECTLGEVVRGQYTKCGTIILAAEELAACHDEVTMQFCATNLEKKDIFRKSDAYLQFSRKSENHTELRVECYHWRKSGNDAFIGSFSTTINKLSRGPGELNEYEVIDPVKKAKNDKKYVNSGKVKLLHCVIQSVSTFMDYIRGGTQVHCTIAVDFTASNKDPRSPDSLHYLDPYKPNLYARALQAVTEIIQDYDTHKQFPALGFGARLPPHGVLSHDFFLNGHPSSPYCQGVDGVLEAYYNTLKSVRLSGPTNFAPVIKHVARTAAGCSPLGAHYYILLILTDGVITDMQETCEAIVAASSLPMSIIIIGIGDADFEDMKVLDGDDVRLSAKGRFAERDIVQFVAFRDFIGGRNGNDLNRCQSMLAKEVLAEIPEQFVSYMKKYDIKPNTQSWEENGTTASEVKTSSVEETPNY